MSCPRSSSGSVRAPQPGDASTPTSAAAGLWRRCVAVPQGTLHQHGIQPASVLMAYAGQGTDITKAAAQVQAYRRNVGAVANHRDHLTQVAGLAFVDQGVQQACADATAGLIAA